MTETRFYKPARLSTQPKPFFSLKPLGPVVQTPVSANLRLNFNPGFFFLLSKAHCRLIFSILFRVSNRQIVGKEN